MPEKYDPNLRISVEFPLHELLSLAVLYDESPDDLELVHDGVWYGESVDLALLRIAAHLARVLGDKELLLRSGAIKAQFDQIHAEDA